MYTIQLKQKKQSSDKVFISTFIISVNKKLTELYGWNKNEIPTLYYRVKPHSCMDEINVKPLQHSSMSTIQNRLVGAVDLSLSFHFCCHYTVVYLL